MIVKDVSHDVENAFTVISVQKPATLLNIAFFH